MPPSPVVGVDSAAAGTAAFRPSSLTLAGGACNVRALFAMKILHSVIVSVCSAIALSAAEPAVTNAVVARVNGQVISREELDTAMKGVMTQFAQSGRSVPPAKMEEFERQVLEDMVSRELVLEEGRGRNFTNIDAQVQTELKRVSEQLGGDEELTKALAETGVSREQYTTRVRDNLIVQETMRHVVEKDTKVTPEEVREAYDKNPEQFKQPPAIRASHILILVPPTATEVEKAAKRAQIEALLHRAKKGEDFTVLAKQFSEDPGSKDQGGDLGFFPRGRMMPEFEIAAFSLKTNQVSDIVTTSYGHHIIKLTDQHPAKQLSFDEVKDDLENFIKSNKANAVARKHITDLRSAAKVEILLPEPVIVPPPTQPSPASENK